MGLSYDNSYIWYKDTFDTVSFLILNIFPFCREDAEKMAALASADKSLLQSSQKQKPVSNNASANSGK